MAKREQNRNESVEVLIKRTMEHTQLDRDDVQSILIEALKYLSEINFIGNTDPIDVTYIDRKGPIVTLKFQRIIDNQEIDVELQRPQ